MDNNNEELIKNSDIQRIAEEGAKIYEQNKTNYDPKEKGKFLAIDIDSKEKFLGDTSAQALELAKAHYPNKIFYVVKIGFDVAETINVCFCLYGGSGALYSSFNFRKYAISRH